MKGKKELLVWSQRREGGKETYLEEQTEGHAVYEGVVVEEGVEEKGAAGLGVVAAQTAIKGFRQ